MQLMRSENQLLEDIGRIFVGSRQGRTQANEMHALGLQTPIQPLADVGKLIVSRACNSLHGHPLPV
jgi:hypothetical protein